ncbi:E3 ubiquitin- ligase MARCH2 [Chlorella sorokiniana]|uniref:E3 ubiquitin-ligase MARCH2 n=1 Tax=Chlorella sorokiniana TaxID=3076 RepID=A0A2P6TU49_CHLSO|nr:E3 ubiquitin- ligase MARCH2 [Chlorella sorokiniana]|eukprot:PRW57583.1 E3 ubiquitin- ligase MARCH2 [Chlorella sorokiniana]
MAEQDHDDPPTCRICFEPALRQRGGRLVQPCSCAGSMAHIHESCLAEAERHSSTPGWCSVCRGRLRAPRRPLSPHVWLTAAVGAALACIATCLDVAEERRELQQAEQARLERRQRSREARLERERQDMVQQERQRRQTEEQRTVVGKAALMLAHFAIQPY